MRDVIVTQINLTESEFILATIYAHQRVRHNDLTMLLASLVLQYSDLVDYLRLKGVMSVLMVVVGNLFFSTIENKCGNNCGHFNLELRNF